MNILKNRKLFYEEKEFIERVIGYCPKNLSLNETVTGRAYSLPFGKMGTSRAPMDTIAGRGTLIHEAFHQYQYSLGISVFPRLVYEQAMYLAKKNVYDYGRENFISGRIAISRLTDIKYLEAQAQFVEDFAILYQQLTVSAAMQDKDSAAKYARVLFNSGIRSAAIEGLLK